jgi:hypothetical protein
MECPALLFLKPVTLVLRSIDAVVAESVPAAVL